MRHIAKLRLITSVFIVAAGAIVGLGALPTHHAVGITLSSSWTVATKPSPAGSWYGVDYVNGQWIAVGHGAEVAVSTDGSTWTEHSVPSGSWQTVAYGAGKYVALSSSVFGPHEMISTNGINWTTTSGPPPPHGPPGGMSSVAFGGGMFVAVGTVGQLSISSDGVTWKNEFMRPHDQFTSVAYGNGRFVVVDGVHGDTLTSFDGVRWAFYLTPNAGSRWSAVTYGNGNFVAFDLSGTGYVARTNMGFVWSLSQYAPAQEIDGATFGCGTFVGVGQSTGSANNIITSPTGANWTAIPVPTDASSKWTSVAYGAHRFVAVNSSGNIASSPSAASCSPTIPLPPPGVESNIFNGEVWSYLGVALGNGGAPVNGYRVKITDGVTTKYCSAPVEYEPNCIIWGLQNRKIYLIAAQSHNRFGYSVPTDPEYVVTVAKWTLDARTAAAVSASTSVLIQVTGVIANSLGIYPYVPVTVHFGSRIFICHPDSFGECLIPVSDPAIGPVAIYATYTGYGTSYRSPTETDYVASVNISTTAVTTSQGFTVTVHGGISNSTARATIGGTTYQVLLDANGDGVINVTAPAAVGSFNLSVSDAFAPLTTTAVNVHS